MMLWLTCWIVTASKASSNSSQAIKFTLWVIPFGNALGPLFHSPAMRQIVPHLFLR